LMLEQLVLARVQGLPLWKDIDGQVIAMLGLNRINHVGLAPVVKPV
jgi:hypothetical protein